MRDSNGFHGTGASGKKGGTTSVAKMFEKLAQDPEAEAAIASIKKRLLAHDVWLWPGGAIEAHLGLTSKTEAAWAKFATEVSTQGLDKVCSDPDTVRAFVDWLAL